MSSSPCCGVKMFKVNVRACRKARKWSQTQLAMKLGVTHQAVSKWETGEAIPTVEMLWKMARCFGTSMEAMIINE